MHVFIAYPFTQLVDEDTNRISFEKQVFLEKTRELVMKKGHTVFLAHYRELWGKNLMSADECTPVPMTIPPLLFAISIRIWVRSLA